MARLTDAEHRHMINVTLQELEEHLRAAENDGLLISIEVEYEDINTIGGRNYRTGPNITANFFREVAP